MKVQWTWWFAWRPVFDVDGYLRFFEFVERLHIPNDFRHLGNMTAGWYVYRK